MKLKLIVACLAGLAVSAPALAVKPFTIKDIRIEGLKATEPSTVFSYMPVKIGDEFTDLKGEQIIKRLFATGFFDDIQVETLSGQVLLTVTERPIISELTVKGAKLIPNKDIKSNLVRMGLAPSHVYNPVLMNDVIEGLKHEYMTRGKNNAQLTPKITPLDRQRVAIELNIEEGETTVIRDIHMTGNEFYSDRKLRNQMALSEHGLLSFFSRDDRFSPETFSSDLEKITALYKNAGFVNAQIIGTNVTANPKRSNDLDLHIALNEGERFRWGEITLAGDNKEVPIESLQKLSKVKTGSWYKEERLTEILQSIKNEMGNAGYAFTEIAVEPQFNEAEHTVGFTLHIEPKRKAYINDINITGNNKTRDEIIRREIRQMENAPFDQGKIARSKERVGQLGFFDDIEITPSPVANAPDQLDLNVTVKERSTGSIDVSAGYAQGDGLVLAGGIAQDNLFGSGKSVSARFSNSSTNQVASLSFTNPYVTPDGISLGYDIFYQKYDPNKRDTSAYKTAKYGAGVRMGVPITEYDRINFGITPNRTKISVFENSPTRYKDYVGEGKSHKTTNTLGGNIGWGRNTTDSAIWPTRGYIIRANADLGLPGGNLHYYTLTHGQQWFFPLTKSLTLMLNGDIGFTKNYGSTKEVPFFLNFYGGGLSSVRGYENSSLGPKVLDSNGGGVDYMGGTRMANFNAEVLFPMPGVKDQRSVRLSVFADAASVWDGKKYTSADSSFYYGQFGKKSHKSSFKNELRYSTGVAFTWLSPMGPMKFSYAYPIKSKKGDDLQRFQFQLGTVF